MQAQPVPAGGGLAGPVEAGGRGLFLGGCGSRSPVVVLISGYRNTARHTIATESDHYIQVEQPDLVTDAVVAVVDAVRDPASLQRRSNR